MQVDPEGAGPGWTPLTVTVSVDNGRTLTDADIRAVTAAVRLAVREEASANSAQLLRLCEVADVLGVSERTVRRLIARGEIAIVGVSRRRRVHPRALDEYLRARSVAGR